MGVETQSNAGNCATRLSTTDGIAKRYMGSQFASTVFVRQRMGLSRDQDYINHP